MGFFLTKGDNILCQAKLALLCSWIWQENAGMVFGGYYADYQYSTELSERAYVGPLFGRCFKEMQIFLGYV